MKKTRLLLTSLAICQLLACSRSEPAASRGAAAEGSEPAPREAMLKVAQKKIFFGHQSVGQNISTAFGDLSGQAPGPGLNLVESSDAGRFDRPSSHMRASPGRDVPRQRFPSCL